MKKNMKYSVAFIVFLFVLMNSCFSKELKIKLIKTNKIQNYSNFFINSINQIDFSPNNKYYLASSVYEKNVYLFNAEKDTLVSIFMPSEDLSDSIADFMNSLQLNFQFFPTTKIREMNQSFNNTTVKNSFVSSTFINDSLIALLGDISVIKLPSNVDIYTTNPNRMRNYLIILIINWKSRTIMKTIPLPDYMDISGNYESFIQSSQIEFDKVNNEFLMSCRMSDYYIDSLKSKNFNTVCRIDLYGKLKGYINKLPEIAIKSEVKYRSHYYQPYISKDFSHKFYFLYEYIPYIYNDKNEVFREITGLIPNNKELFDTLISRQSQKLNFVTFNEYFAKYNKIAYRKVFFGKNDSYFVWASSQDEEDSNYIHHTLVKYSTKNQSIIKCEIPFSNENGILKNVHYNPVDNNLKVFRMKELDWTIETYSIL